MLWVGFIAGIFTGMTLGGILTFEILHRISDVWLRHAAEEIWENTEGPGLDAIMAILLKHRAKARG